ncbi:MAG: hypothetical protein NXY57DRAFT_1079884 [Lentinula lateritia]|nr:MAG: hypothetical protein NXY57DRAFT_1079884 [Lentinula lateritia]
MNVLLTTYELVLRDAKELGDSKWQVLAVDEAHHLKLRESALMSFLCIFSSRLAPSPIPKQASKSLNCFYATPATPGFNSRSRSRDAETWKPIENLMMNVHDKLSHVVSSRVLSTPAEIWAQNSHVTRMSIAEAGLVNDPYSGHSSHVVDGDLADAFRRLDMILARNKVRKQLKLAERHEKKGPKRRRLESECWRWLFAHELLFLDRKHAEYLDPQDDWTSSIRSRLIGISQEYMELGRPPGSAGSAGSGALITPPGAGDRTAQPSNSNNSQACSESSRNSGPLSPPQLPPLLFDSSSAADDVREERALLTPITEWSSVYTASVMRSGMIGTIGIGFGPSGSTGGRNSGYGFQGPSPVLEESNWEGSGSVSPKVLEKDSLGMRGMSFSWVGPGGGGRKSVDVPSNVNTTSGATPASPPPPTRSISPMQGNASGGGTGSPTSRMLPHLSFESFSNAVNTALPKSKPTSPILSPSLSPLSSTMSPPTDFPNLATANPSKPSNTPPMNSPTNPESTGPF